MKSCGIPAPTETKVDFSSAEILKSFAVADSFGQNLYIFSINAYSPDNMLYFQKTFHSDKKSEQINDFKLPNGQWYFYGITFNYNKEELPKLKHLSVKCFYSSVNLDGIPKEITLNIKQENCSALLNSSDQNLPKVSFHKIFLEEPSGTVINGSNRSIKVSLVTTKMYKLNDSNEIELESKTSIVPIDPTGNSTNSCYTLILREGGGSGENQYYQFPFSKSTQNIWPMVVLIEGFLDENCTVADPKTKTIVFNSWLQPNYSLDGTSLNFVEKIKHPAMADNNSPSEIYWTAEKKHNGQVCFDNDNCEDGLYCVATDEGVCLPE